MNSPLEAFDTVAFSEALLGRLHAAKAELSRKQGLKDEKSWLATAVDRLAAAREGVGDLLTRVLKLDELAPLREEHARTLQHSVIDAVERLQAGITFHGGSRAPVLETLYGKLKLPPLRRAEREDFERFCADFEKRLNGSYVKRMLADEAFAPIAPALAEVRKAFSTWRSALSPEPVSEAEAKALRSELDAAARKLELPLRQARLLAEAACAPVKDLYESSGLAAKPKKRSVRLARPLEEDVAEAEAAADALEPQAKPPRHNPEADEVGEAPPLPAAPAPQEPLGAKQARRKGEARESEEALPQQAAQSSRPRRARRNAKAQSATVE
ncbi:MAG: hypothetical protein AB1938_20785 [Myxococcota bacterium]